MKKTKLENLMGYLFISPAVIIFLVFMAIPLILSLILSFTNYDTYTIAGVEWVGFDNFRYLIEYDDSFWNSLGNIFIYTIVIIPINMFVSFFLAYILRTKTKGNATFRLLYYIPVLTSAVATAAVWKYLFDPNIGLFNEIVTLVGLTPVTLTSVDTAKTAIIIVTLWMGFGANMMMYIAALQGVPEDVYEAARIEGANEWNLLTKITIPLVKPVTTFVVIMSLIGVPQMFEQVLIMTGTNSTALDTQTPVLMIFNNLNETGGLPSVALAQAMILFIIIMIITFGTRQLRGEEY